MPRFEYKVIPAPTKGRRGKGVKGAEAKFANAIEELMNEMAGDGWEYQRAETLPSVERAGLAAATTEWRNVLIFRRAAAGDISEFKPELLPAPSAQMPPDVIVTSAANTTPFIVPKEKSNGAADPSDNGVEDHTSQIAEDGPGSALSVLARNRRSSK